jgi:chromosome segregation ATPase
MESQLSLSIIEIIVLMLGAILVGVTIHFVISSRRSLKASSPAAHMQVNKDLADWKLRYFNEIESRDKDLAELKKRITDSEENNHILSIEAEESRKECKRLQAEINAIRSNPPQQQSKAGYMDQLAEARNSLKEYNEKINQLLGQIDLVKEAEEKQQEILKSNEELESQVGELRAQLSRKEKEIHTIQQKQELTNEMTSLLDSTYNEFNSLQDKIQKLEGQVGVSKKISMEYEDLKEEHFKASRDLEEIKHKYLAAASENKELQETLRETEDKLREANFQRLQLQKKVAYLEELNIDMQAVTDANKKLENQLKRIGELESMLNMVAEERDELVKRRAVDS